MLGLKEPLESAWEQVRTQGVQAIVNLAEQDEIRRKSPAYALALEGKHVPCAVIRFAVRNRRTPNDSEAFWQVAVDVAQRLRLGERILIHCMHGQGRTGTMATCVLVALGETQEAAADAVEKAGSTPETKGQAGIVAWCVQRRQQQG
jgi:protein-tyrosine phosphatase